MIQLKIKYNFSQFLSAEFVKHRCAISWTELPHRVSHIHTHTHTTAQTHQGPVSPSKLCSSNLVLLLRPFRDHQFEMNKLAATTVPSLKDTSLTRALLKHSQPHSQLLSATAAGRGCEKRACGVIVRDSMALSYTHTQTHSHTLMHTHRVLLNS